MSAGTTSEGPGSVGGDRVEPVAAARGERDPVARGGQPRRDRAADAAAGAGHQAGSVRHGAQRGKRSLRPSRYLHLVLLTVVLITTYFGGMRIAVLGGGPGGLYFAALAQAARPRHEITVWERNAPDDTFGFGVVFSDETLGGIEHADPDDLPGHAARVRPLGRHRHRTTAATTLTSGGHGFAALEPRAACWRSCRSAAPRWASSVRFRTEAPAAPNSSRSYDLVVAADGANCATRRGSPGTSAPRSRPAAASTSGSAPTWSSTPSRSRSSTPRTASCRSTATRTAATRAPSSWRCTRTSGERAGFERTADEERRVRRAHPRALRGRARRAPAARATTPAGRASRPSLDDAGGTATSSCSATPRTPRTSPSAPAPSWPWRTPWRWPPACANTRSVPAALAAYEEERRPVVASTQRAAQASLEWFENIGQLHGPGPARVRVQPPHPQPPRHPRQPAAARPGVRRRRSTGGSPPSRARRGAPPMFHPFRLARLELAQPRGRLADGHVLRRGRRARRLPPRAPRRPGARRRGPGHDRDGVRVARRAASPPAAPGLYTAEQEAAWRRIVDFVHGRRRRADRPPARPLRPQGLDPADVGGHRRAAARRQLAGLRPLADPVLGRRSQVPRELTAGDSPRSASSSPPSARAARAGGLRPARTALRARLPALIVPLAR